MAQDSESQFKAWSAQITSETDLKFGWQKSPGGPASQSQQRFHSEQLFNNQQQQNPFDSTAPPTSGTQENADWLAAEQDPWEALR